MRYFSSLLVRIALGMALVSGSGCATASKDVRPGLENVLKGEALPLEVKLPIGFTVSYARLNLNGLFRRVVEDDGFPIKITDPKFLDKIEIAPLNLVALGGTFGVNFHREGSILYHTLKGRMEGSFPGFSMDFDESGTIDSVNLPLFSTHDVDYALEASIVHYFAANIEYDIAFLWNCGSQKCGISFPFAIGYVDSRADADMSGTFITGDEDNTITNNLSSSVEVKTRGIYFHAGVGFVALLGDAVRFDAMGGLRFDYIWMNAKSELALDGFDHTANSSNKQYAFAPFAAVLFTYQIPIDQE